MVNYPICCSKRVCGKKHHKEFDTCRSNIPYINCLIESDNCQHPVKDRADKSFWNLELRRHMRTITIRIAPSTCFESDWLSNGYNIYGSTQVAVEMFSALFVFMLTFLYTVRNNQRTRNSFSQKFVVSVNSQGVYLSFRYSGAIATLPSVHMANSQDISA